MRTSLNRIIMSFTRISLFSLLLMFVAVFATGCEEDDLQINPEIPGSANVEARMAAVMGRALPPSDSTSMNPEDLCFTFNFPLSFVLENGETITFENEDQLNDELNGEVFIADFVYPFTVTLSDGTVSTIDNFEGLLEILTGCYGDFEDWEDGDWDDEHDNDCPGDYDFDGDLFCFDFVYPINFSGPDSSIVEVNSEEEFFELLESLDEETVESFDFVFPFTIVTAFDSAEVVINDYEELDAVFEACFDFGDWDNEDGDDGDWDDWGDDVFGGHCYVPTFPLTLLINGEEVILESPDDVGTLVFDSTLVSIELAFPLNTIELATGETVTFETEEDFEAALDDCDEGFDDGDFEWEADDFEECFTVNFPITLIINDEPFTVADEEGLTALFESLQDFDEVSSIELGYPLTVTLTESGEVITINNEEEWEALCDYCHGEFGDDDDDGDDDEGDFEVVDFDVDCLTFNFPVEVELEGQGVIPVTDLEQLNIIFTAASGLEAEIDFVYPISVNVTETGETIDVMNNEALELIFEQCEE